MFKKSLLLVLLSLGVLTFVGQNASANWTEYGTLDWLDPESRDLGQGRRYQVYRAYLLQGERVWIWQLSSEIDSYLYLVGPYGNFVAMDDDAAGGKSYSHSARDAFIYYNAQVTGWHYIVASSYSPNEYGYFELWVYEDD